MKDRSRASVVSLTGLSFLSLCLLGGPLSHAAKPSPTGSGKSPNNQKPTSLKRQTQSADGLRGQWQVKCEVRIYDKGALISSSQDSDASLVVAETDSDGSYRLYKFPWGFGEAFPRLRSISANQYAGDDTVRGITTLVKQSVDIENERITIRQATIDTPSNQTETDITCTGTRPQSTLRFPARDSAAEICQPGLNKAALSDGKIARRFKSARPFSDGLAAVAMVPRGGQGLKWGFVDETGRVVIPMVYDAVTSFRDGLAVVGKSYGSGGNLKWGVVEKLGPQVSPHLNYDAAKILGEGFAAVGYAISGRQGLRWNLINRENTTILHGFDDFGCFVDGRARASYTDGKVIRKGYINRVGDFIADDK